MKEAITPSVFTISITPKGRLKSEAPICVKNPDTHFLYDVLKIIPEWQLAREPGRMEHEGEIIFLSSHRLRKIQVPRIYNGMGIWCNLKPFRVNMSHRGGIFERPRPIAMLWLKTTGKNAHKYDNEYQFENLNKTQCYKIARFLRENDYKFSPELNNYLFLRCGIKFDLNLMDVEVVSFNDIEGRGTVMTHEPFSYMNLLKYERDNYEDFLPPRAPFY